MKFPLPWCQSRWHWADAHGYLLSPLRGYWATVPLSWRGARLARRTLGEAHAWRGARLARGAAPCDRSSCSDAVRTWILKVPRVLLRAVHG